MGATWPPFSWEGLLPKRQWTDEQRKAASERAKARWAGSAAVAEPEAPAEADDDDVLRTLAATLLKAADKKANQRKTLEELGAVLDRIDPKDHPELADDPTIQAFVEKITGIRVEKAREEGKPPGTVIGSGLNAEVVPWTEADLTNKKWGCLNEQGEPWYVTFTPNETIPVFYNGIRCQLIADQEITCLKCFKDVYDEHKRLMRVADQHRQYMFARSDSLPPELATTDAAISTARVRAFMSMGGEKGGGRVTVGYPGDATFELRDIPGAQGVATSEQTGQT